MVKGRENVKWTKSTTLFWEITCFPTLLKPHAVVRGPSETDLRLRSLPGRDPLTLPLPLGSVLAPLDEIF